jgi:uncharacterized protein YaiL (DUF2058 family)
MTIGLQLQKAQLDRDLGQTALALRKVLAQIEQLHHFCLITPDATLVNLGYTQAEVNTIKSAFVDGDTLNSLATGTGTLAAPQNLLANLDQLAGDLLTS